jgi:preprotein translocase subunit SecD
MKKLIGIIFMFCLFSCSKDINLKNGFVQYLDENKKNIFLYIVNDDATTEFNEYYREINDDNKETFIANYLIPENNKLMGYYGIKDNWDETFFEYIILYDDAVPIGEHFTKMNKKLTEIGILISFYLDSNGNKIFYELTSNNIKKGIAIVIDGKIIVYVTILRALENTVNFNISQ